MLPDSLGSLCALNSLSTPLWLRDTQLPGAWGCWATSLVSLEVSSVGLGVAVVTRFQDEATSRSCVCLSTCELAARRPHSGCGTHSCLAGGVVGPQAWCLWR
jgi:hypothetical protein